ncbi:hypothetical protein DMI65_13470 [Escherichia coli]|nr:hypothetical protein [Escherichia coli]
MPDATLTRLIRPTGQCQTRRPDKAFTPHPAVGAIMPDATLTRLIRPTGRCQHVGRIRRLRRIRQSVHNA